MQPIISMSMWTSLSNEQRNRIRVLFKIPRSRSTEVNDGQIISDGTTPEDFKALTIEKMQVYLHDNSSTDFHKMFDRVISKVQEEIEGKSIIVEPTHLIVDNEKLSKIATEITKSYTEPTPKRRGRPSKKNA